MEEYVNNPTPAPIPTQNSLGNKGRFQINKKNKIALLVIMLVILVGGGMLLFISIVSKNNSPFPGVSKNEKSIDFAHTSLSISEDVRPSSVAGKYEADVNIDTSDNIATGVQLELSFDPAVLQNVDIIIGTFFTNPTVIQKTVDQKNGKIIFTLSTPIGGDGVQGKGTVAVISFSKTNSQETMIGFLPKTLVSAQGQDQSVLKETAGASISTLPSSSASPNLTPQ